MATSETVKDPDLPYESAVFGLEQFQSEIAEFHLSLDPTVWKLLLPHDLTVKEKKLIALYEEFAFWKQKVIISCSVIRDPSKTLSKHKKTIMECTETLEKLQVTLLRGRERLDRSEADNKGPTEAETATQELIAKLLASKSDHSDADFKLEKIKPPTFSGAYNEWQNYSDLFRAAVIDNKRIPGALKLVYLKNSLVGDAANIAASFPPTNLSFDEAWKLVEERYDKKREIVFSHLQKLFSLSSVPDTTTGIRKLVDTINQCTRSLKLLGVKVHKWDVFLVYWAHLKLDPETRKQWLLSADDELPQLSPFLEFLEKRAMALTCPSSKKSNSTSTTFSSSHHTTAEGKPKPSCFKCGESHRLYHCPQFKPLTPHQKAAWVKDKKLCSNCLGNHQNPCKSEMSCRICGKRHHSLLHFESRPVASAPQSRAEPRDQPSNPSSSATTDTPTTQPEPSTSTAGQVNNNHATSTFNPNSVVLMATLLVKVCDSDGQFHPCRVFLDSGSETNFASESFVTRFGLKREKSCVQVTGIGGSIRDTARGIVAFSAHSTVSSFSLPVNALVLPKLTGLLPREKCQVNFPHLVGLSLSDPLFHTPASIDVLMGAEAISRIILPGLKIGPVGTPIAQNSKFGWYLTGSTPLASTESTRTSNFNVTVCHSSCVADEQCLESSLKRFWELEDPSPLSSSLSSEDQLSENHFLSTFTRDSDGRYEVHLPFSPNCGILGNSRPRAISCFKSLEKQFQKDPQLKDAYHSQIQEYISRDWVTSVPVSQINSKEVPVTTTGGDQVHLPPFYLPHHVVVKLDNSTTKYRIVFNASAKTDSGNSLNSILLSGPKIQTDLHPLLTRFRTNPIALGADIVKFFPQVKVTHSHWDFQRFIWRREPTDNFTDLQFKRVIFGVTSSPFLAIRALRQLWEEYKEEFPLANESIKSDFLVDNLLSGAQTLEEAMDIKGQLIQVLNKGKFPLQKWISNHPQILNSVPLSERESISLNIQEDESIKTIGLYWHPTSDTFGVKIAPLPSLGSATKREVLSHTARVFDPLQWLSPVTITPKILLQSLWKEKLGWDEPIPQSIFRKWKKYCEELEILRQFRIPRCLTFTTFSNSSVKYELIGFCDASNLAYSACVYLRSTSEESTKVILIESKAKVTPVHGETTPRLELCSAVILAKLINSVNAALIPTKIIISSVSCFTDSTGALGQLFSQEKQPPFVANRVRKIRNSPILIQWYHVPGESNPADLPSRGIPAKNLLQNPLWLHGPPFLVTGDFPPQPYSQTVASFTISVLPGEDFVNERLTHLLQSKSSFTKMKRLVGYWIRFINNSNKTRIPIHGPLTLAEEQKALIPIVKCVQTSCFAPEIERCLSTLEVQGQIRFLSPFLDKNGILRVGGRLQSSSLPFQSRHPILLPKCPSRPSTPQQKKFSNFVWSVARDFHERNLHAAPKLLLSLIRSEFWIPRGQDLCSRIYRKCIPCFKQSRQPSTQFMGPLPSPRVVPDFPFIKVGLDYAGPLTIAATPGRKPRLMKAWVCVFVCMSTKAVHLEFSGGLSTPDFISALQRFCSIRNSPSDIFCDGGTNFLGAKEDMDKLQNLITSDDHRKKVTLFSIGEKVNFHFSPPKGPHHGGLWEAAVKSMKLHLNRIVQGHHISIEEFITLLARISAALNSRPLTPLSNNPDDFSVLTPFHFLTLRAPKEISEEDVTNMKSHSSRWQLVQQMTQHLSRRWTKEYLHHLQNRTKWLEPKPNISKGTFVLLHDLDSSLGPQRWILGRIEEAFPGKDGRVRICDVRIPIPETADKTQKKKFKILRRPITRLSPLPLDEEVTGSFIALI